LYAVVVAVACHASASPRSGLQIASDTATPCSTWRSTADSHASPCSDSCFLHPVVSVARAIATSRARFTGAN
jgi:hypothetical protein